MTTFLTILLVIIFLKLVTTAGIRPVRSQLSLFELDRRAEMGDAQAVAQRRRETLLLDILSLQRVIMALLLVAFIAISVAALGWLYGILLSVVVALEYSAIARLSYISGWANRFYVKYEPLLLRFVERFSGVLRFIRAASPQEVVAKLSSKQELEHLVAESESVLSTDERKLIINGLGFDEKKVHEIMTPKSVIESISKKEHLGPLVLNDLHNTGHSRFPVIDGDIDHVVGTLHIQDLLTIDAKRRSTSVEKAMEPRVFYIKEDQTLQHALAAFLRTHHHLFIVVNEFRETVGLLSLEDVVEALLGRKIIDEFDTHEDLRMVAGRNPRSNNHPRNHTDV